MKTVEDVNHEYEEAIRPAREQYGARMQAVEAIYNAELVKIQDKFKDGFTVIQHMKQKAIVAGDSNQIAATEDLERELLDDRKRAHQDADRRLRLAQAPIKAEYGTATRDAQRRRWEELSRVGA